MDIFIGIVIMLILLCGVVVSVKAASKRGRNHNNDAVYRDNYRYRQERNEQAEEKRLEFPVGEDTAEPANLVQEEIEGEFEAEQNSVVAPGEDIPK